MTGITLELLVILGLVLANGLFSMSEMAIVSARKARLKQAADQGDRGARSALELAHDPNRFLSTVQVGITLVGTLAGVFGGATLAEKLAARFERIERLAPYSEPLGLTIVVVGIAYVSLVLGELVPKRLALARPEQIAKLVSRPLLWISAVSVPAIRLLGVSTDFVLRCLRVRPTEEPPITEEELRLLLKEGAKAGVFAQAEHDMLRKVFRLDDLQAGGLMTRRSEVIWIDVADPPEKVREIISASPHAQFPVCEESLDRVLGIIRVKDLLLHGARGRMFDVKGLLKVPLFIFERTPGLKVLEMFKESNTHFAIVLDEYGSVEGVLTLNDILQAIVGELPGHGEVSEPKVVRRDDGSWLVDGMTTLHEFEELFDGYKLPNGDYRTIAGFVIDQLGRIPSVAESCRWGRYQFEVVDMDRNRVDKILVTLIDTVPGSETT